MDYKELLEEIRRVQDTRKTKHIRIALVNIKEADTEYRWQLPKGLQWFTLHVRDGTALRIAIAQGVVAVPSGKYFTLKANTSWDERNLDIDDPDMAFYFACDSATKVVEILIGIGERNAS